MGYRGNDSLVKGVALIDASDDSLDYRVLMSPNQAIACAKACGEYNEATPANLERFIRGAAKICDIALNCCRGSGVGICFGREYSRVLYVYTTGGGGYSAEQRAALETLAKDCHADEYAPVAHNCFPYAYRVWWD